MEDQDALREREVNLREYEERLRNWQAQLDAGRHGVIPAAQGLRASLPGLSYTPGPGTNIGDEAALQSGWEKLHRAREILEAEQTHLRDDRITIREMEAAVKRREEAVAAKEAQLAEREKLILAAMPTPPAPGMGSRTLLDEDKG
jgi:DNA repair exonuclease SbcCD ATPase subunit